MEPLLKTLAREYSKRYPSLKNVCFLFPNKRCGLFLRKYFAEYGVKTEDLPHILTISEFVVQTAKKKEATKIDQLLTLYVSYLELLNSDPSKKNLKPDFESFRNWGETVLSDFNTVDLNLGDTDEIFKNVKDYRELSSTFLTEDQKEVMRDYFGVEEFDDYKKFWKNFETISKDSSLKNQFINLWQLLAPLHKKFLEKLDSSNSGSSGSIYRLAANIIEDKRREAVPYNKIVAVGFNALTESERVIFKNLKKSQGTPGYDDFIDFVWDLNGPPLLSGEFSASRFVEHNLKHFPYPEWLKPVIEKEEVTEYPLINIISAPSNTAQAKVAGELLRHFSSPADKEMIKNSEVALILPDEGLLTNVLYSLPEDIGEINLTMGYSLKVSAISSFMSLLRILYLKMRESKNGIVFIAKDLKAILSHPFSYIIFKPNEVEELLGKIEQFHKVVVTLKEIKEVVEDASLLFELPSKDSSSDSIFTYLFELLSTLIAKLSDSDSHPEENQDISQIKIYGEYLSSLKESVDKFGLKLPPISVFNLVDKLISNAKIGFEGEPLSGLQVMGTLETRSIDFKHLLVLSMNEGIMPRKTMTPSFLPESLRRSYGLPPAKYAEEIFSYYFYRLISRAEKVTLLYDGRTINGQRGGVSRYLLQLKQFVPKEKIVEESWQYRLQNHEPTNNNILKTPEILALTDAFTTTGENRKNLSASYLNTYRECQVRFFLQNLLNLNSESVKDEYMDPISVGNILHEVMMDIYLPEESCRKKLLKSPVTITKKFLQEILDDTTSLRRNILKKVNKFYYGTAESDKKIDSGVTEIMAEQIEDLVTEIVKYDKKLAPFHLYGCEISQNLRVTLKSGRVVNFRFAIDRLDEIETEKGWKLRIVDYKTGARKRYAKSIEEIFAGGYYSEQIFQLFTYAWLLEKIGMERSQDVITEIYFVPDLVKEVGGLPEIDNVKVESFLPYREEFSERLENLLESIFSDEYFKEASDPGACKYCGFRSYCNKA